MAPTKGQRSIKEGTSSQEPSRPKRSSRTSTNARAQGNVPHPFVLTNSEHVAGYTCSNERIIVATRYYDEELLGRLGLLDDTRWLFACEGMRHFIEMKEQTYRDYTLEFQSTLHVEVTREPQCQVGYISCLLYTSPSPRDGLLSRMPSSA